MSKTRRHRWLVTGLLAAAAVLAGVGINCRSTKPAWPAVEATWPHFHRIPAHSALPCASCHIPPADGRFEVLTTACASCHGQVPDASDFLEPPPTDTQRN